MTNAKRSAPGKLAISCLFPLMLAGAGVAGRAQERLLEPPRIALQEVPPVVLPDALPEVPQIVLPEGEACLPAPQAETISQLLEKALDHNKRLWPPEAVDEAAQAIEEVSRTHGFSPELVLSVIQHESGFRLDAVSRRGAVGLTQVLPSTAARTARSCGLDRPTREGLMDPGTNIRLGFTYLAGLRDRYGSLDVALAAYRNGPRGAKMDPGRNPRLGAYLTRIRRTEQAIGAWMITP
jgi:soluble lytic murein transglycosylase-like protein